VTVVFKMLVNLIPEYAGLAIPLGVMLGILFAFRKLATTSELDVMRAVGLSYTRLLRVPYLITLVLMGVNFAIVGYWQPLARYSYEQMTSSCARERWRLDKGRRVHPDRGPRRSAHRGEP
jgi:lipopolysaccharide export system permease protein